MRRGARVRGRGTGPGPGSGHEAAVAEGGGGRRGPGGGAADPGSWRPEALGGQPCRRVRGSRPARVSSPLQLPAFRRSAGNVVAFQRAASAGSRARPSPHPATAPPGGPSAAWRCPRVWRRFPGAEAASPFSADSWRRGRGLLRRPPSAALPLHACSCERGCQQRGVRGFGDVCGVSLKETRVGKRPAGPCSPNRGCNPLLPSAKAGVAEQQSPRKLG